MTSDSELALLIADGKLPSEMMPPPAPPPPVAPPRFCGFGPGSPIGPTAPPIGPIAPPMAAAGSAAPTPIPDDSPDDLPVPAAGSPASGVAGSGPAEADGGVAGRPGGAAGKPGGAAGSAGGAAGSPDADGGSPSGPDPACGSVPIGFWRFDDCNDFRTDLGDSSFEGHTAFRTVDLTCAPGQQGLAASFTHPKDIVYVPDQPAYALEFGLTIAAWVRPDSVTDVSTIFRKSGVDDSAFALVVHKRNYEFVVRLTSGQLVSVAAPATAGKWTHVAATYDNETLRLYLDGVEVSHKRARGVAARGEGPLLIGNDGSGRMLHGRIDNAWFNTQAAPAATILQLLCLRRDPTLAVTPKVGPSVAAGTPVVFTFSVHSEEDAKCPAASFSASLFMQQGGFDVEPSFADVALANGETFSLDVTVTSDQEAEAGNYPLEFDLFSNDSGGFGGPVFSSGPIGTVVSSGPGVVVTTGTAGGGAVGAPPEEPAPPVFNGFVSIEAEYVVAEPTGCHVSSQRELMIRDVGVVEDPVRTVLNGPAGNPATGVWSFGGLMQRLSPTAADAADNAEQLFRSFLSNQTINSFVVEPRQPMDTLVLSTWPRTADGKLDLARAPVRLLAITHRFDLEDLPNGKAGEGRFTYGVLDPSGNQMEFTIIFEYLLAASDADDARTWIDDVHALQELPFPSEEYNVALQAVTDRFTGRNVLPSAKNGSALIDIRTNEIALGSTWQLREFRISPESGFMAPHPLFQTPDSAFNFQPILGQFINENEDIILTERHEVPLLFQDAPFEAGAVFNNIDFWDAPGITNPEARHKFSLNTCNGCHGAETQTAFLQINPREPGQPSTLSGFLTGEDVFDPITSQMRHFNELGRRRGLLEALICQ